MEFETYAVNGGLNPKNNANAISPPIYQTSAFEFENVQHAADLFDLKTSGHIYTRISNPTTEILEKRLSLLEGGVGALALSSGQSASLISILNITSSGEEIVASSSLYGGTFNLFDVTFKKFGIKVNFVNGSKIDDYEKAINNKTKCIFIESVTNPQLTVADIESLANLAHSYNIPLIVDNTVPSPYLLRPFEFGADIVVHSITKYISGHSNSMGGAIIDSGNFDWEKSGKFPSLVNEDPSYHGLSYTKEFSNLAYIVKARVQLLRDLGTTISPFNAYLTLLGIETLHLRIQRHSDNALKIAKFLENHKSVSWVKYPLLENDANYTLAKKYLKNGASSIVSFGIKGEQKNAIKFIESLNIPLHVTNIGDVRTIVTYPALTTHRQLSDEAKIACGIGNDFIRLSVGLENINDLISDLDQALIKSQA